MLEVSCAYDARNRLAEIDANGKATQFGYGATGYRTNAIWPNGTVATYAYDDAGQLLSLVHGRAGSTNPPLASFAYAYDLSGNRTHMITLEGTNAYAYDARNWLTFAAYPDGNAETFAYDSVGNRIHLGGAGSIPTDYTYGPVNRLISSTSPAATNAYTYDSAGRLVGQTVNDLPRAYGYDFMSRMTALTDTNGSVFNYAFDGEGNRIRQSLNDCLSTRFVYDGPNVVMELNASNEIVRAYVNGPGMDQPIERIEFIGGTPRNRQVFHADGLGSIAALTDESGEPVQTYTYAAFGGIRARTGSDLNRVTFTAREALGDSLGFYYYRNRVLDPNTGRFTSEDPLKFIDGPNRYVYVMNNPIIFADQFGFQHFKELQAYANDGRLKDLCDNMPVGDKLDMPAAVAGAAVSTVAPPLGQAAAMGLSQIGLTGVNQALNQGEKPEMLVPPLYRERTPWLGEYYCVPK